MTTVEHSACAACGDPNTCFMFGASGKVQFWLCGPCYSITPHAVNLALESTKRLSADDNDDTTEQQGRSDQAGSDALSVGETVQERPPCPTDV